MHQCISSKEVIIRSNDRPWYDSEIRQYSRKRDKQNVIAVRSKRIKDWVKYNKMSNKVNNLKTHAKEQYFNNIEQTVLDTSKSNPKLYWKILKQCIKSN